METGRIDILNRLFTRNTVRHFIQGGKDDIYTSAIKRYIADVGNKNNRELISEVYCILRHEYRNEYYYKNTLLNKLLLGVHSINTTTALTEISIAKSKADFVLINGKAVVYEIKTELDNLERLSSQIADYYKAFDHVAIVTCEKNICHVLNVLERMDKPVGIYVIRENGKIGTIRKPQRYDKDIKKDSLFKLLRKHEYENIIIQRYGCLPAVSQFKYYETCRELFSQIPVDESYLLVIKELKNRSSIEKENFVKIPYELRFLVYFMGLRGEEYRQLEVFLDDQFGGA